MRQALARHDALLREAIEAHDGFVLETVGDAQRALQAEGWELPGPVRVRMALHTGKAEEREGDYFGSPLNRCARIPAGQ